jgi:hypothetical protein
MIQFNQIDINPTFAHLDARLLADLGVAGPGEGVHPSQLRRLPSKPNAVAVLFKVLARIVGSAPVSVRSAG